MAVRAETAGALAGCPHVPSGTPGRNSQTPVAHCVLLSHSSPTANKQTPTGLQANPLPQAGTDEQHASLNWAGHPSAFPRPATNRSITTTAIPNRVMSAACTTNGDANQKRWYCRSLIRLLTCVPLSQRGTTGGFMLRSAESSLAPSFEKGGPAHVSTFENQTETLPNERKRVGRQLAPDQCVGPPSRETILPSGRQCLPCVANQSL